MNFYTVSMEYRGGTYISQIWANDEVSALMQWAVKLDDKSIKGVGKKVKQRIINELGKGCNDNIPLPINGLVNAWCACLLVWNKFMIVDIFQTESSKPNRSATASGKTAETLPIPPALAARRR